MTLVPKLAGVINAAKGVFAAFNAVCAANPYVLIIAAIVALVAAFIYLWNNCEEFRQFWIDLWESIKEIAIAVWEALKAFFQAAWEAIKTTATTVWNAIKDFFSGLWEGIKNIFTTVVRYYGVQCDQDVLHNRLEWNQVGYHDCGKCDFHLPEYGVERD